MGLFCFVLIGLNSVFVDKRTKRCKVGQIRYLRFWFLAQRCPGLFCVSFSCRRNSLILTKCLSFPFCAQLRTCFSSAEIGVF